MDYDITTNRIFFGLFLLATLIIGLWAGRNVKTLKDYYFANMELGVGTLVITLIATLISADELMQMREGYTRGVLVLSTPIFTALSCLLMGYYVFPKLSFFRGSYTLSDVMERIYGRPAAVISCCLNVLFSMSLIAMQFIALAALCGSLGVNEWQVIVIAAIATTLYTFSGGIRAVAATDVLQFIIVIVALLLMVNLGLHLKEVGGIKNLFSTIKAQHPSYLYFWQHKRFGFKIFSSLFWGGSLMPIYLLTAPIMRIVLMTNDKKQVKQVLKGFSIFYGMFFISMLLIGLIATVTSSNYLKYSDTLPYVLDLFCGNEYFKAFFLLSFFALALSTADSYLNALSVSIYHDIIDKIKIFDNEKVKIRIIRYTSLVIGSITTLISFLFLNERYIVVGAYTLPIFSSLCLPFVLGVLGLKGSGKTFIIYFSTFLAVFFASIGLDLYAGFSVYPTLVTPATPGDHYSIASSAQFFAVILSTIVFFVTHYVENGRFVWIKHEKGTQFTSKLLDDDLPWYHFFVRPLRWAQNKVAIYQGQPVLLALFMAVFYMLPNFTIKTSEKEVYFQLLGGLRIVGIGLCTALAMKNQWPKRWERCYHLLYFVTILYCLPFVNTLLFLYDPQDALAIVLFLLHILLMITLVDWRTFVMFSISGTGLAWIIYMLLEGRAFPAMNFDTGWTLLVGLFFTLLIGFLFARKKQQSYEEWLAQHRYLAKQHKQTAARFQKAYQFQYDVAHGINKDGVDVVSKLQEVEKLIAEHGTEKHPEIKKAHEQLGMVKAHLRDVLYKHREHLKLSVDKCSIKGFMKKLEDAAHKAGLDTQQLFFVKKTKQTEVVCDVAKIAQAFVHMLQESQAKNLTQAPIYVCCCDALLGYPLTKFEDQIKKVKALEIVITTDTAINDKVNRYQGDIEIGSHIPATKLNIPSVERDRILGAHYGVFDSGLPVGINKQLFVIPCNVRDIRSKAMDVDEAPNGHYVEHPKEAEVEQKFYDKAAAKAPHILREQLEKAVDLIRRYHAHQRRKSGEPFYLHPIEVATILLDVTQEQDVIIAALCHDIVEDAAMDFSQLTLLFGQNMVDLVSGVSKLDKGTRKKKMSSSENIQQLINQKDQRVLYIKIADRVHNMRTIGAHDLAKRKKIAEETLQCFVVLAKRLRLVEMAQELEELALAVLNK